MDLSVVLRHTREYVFSDVCNSVKAQYSFCDKGTVGLKYEYLYNVFQCTS